MESFSLLKYWKYKGGGARGGHRRGGVSATSTTASAGEGVAPPLPTTTIVTTVAGDSDSGGDDGSFFDLEFAVPTDVEDDDDEVVGDIFEERENENDDDDDEEEEESILEPPSDAVFLNDRVVQLGDSEDVEEINSKSAQFPIPASLLRSATKFRVFMLGLKRSKSESNSSTEKPQNSPPQSSGVTTKKLFTVKIKFRVEDVRLFSLLTRATSNSKLTAAAATSTATGGERPDTAEEKRQKKELIQKYLKLVKPLYIRALKRGQAAEDTAEATVERNEVKKGMKLMRKQMLLLRNNNNIKSKSAVVHSMPHNNNNNQNNNSNYNNSSNTTNNVVSSKRSDDSLLEQQDGIQGAILHCKRSFRSLNPGEAAPESQCCQEAATAVLATEVTRQEVENDIVIA